MHREKDSTYTHVQIYREIDREGREKERDRETDRQGEGGLTKKSQCYIHQENALGYRSNNHLYFQKLIF